MSAVRLAKQHRAAGMDGQLDRMKQLLDRLAGPEDLASNEREDDHDAAGRREVDVVDGCLGNVGHPRSYVVPLAAQWRWARWLSGGPARAVSQRGGRGLAGAAGRQALTQDHERSVGAADPASAKRWRAASFV